MKLRTILTLLFVTIICIEATSAQRYTTSNHSSRKAPVVASSTVYRGNDARSFELWMEGQLRDDFQRLKKSGVRTYGQIKVNYVVSANGKVSAGKHEDTKARGKVLDSRISSAINRVLTRQNWSVAGRGKIQRNSFIMNY